jgi:hypothetical protein
MEEIENQPSDSIDKFCDPNKPVIISFNDVSSAAYRIKGAIDTTPCTVKTSNT